jgi:pimeloyl-ACP methyl ester carboxylesterase
MWGLPEDWRWVRALLEEKGVEVVAPDLPSHRFPDAGLLDDVDEVRAAIRTAGWSPTVVAGWSYGCDVAGVAADGENVARFVFVSSVPLPVQPVVREDTLFDEDPIMVWDEDGRFVPRAGWWREGMEFSSEAISYLEANARRPVTRRTLSDPILAAAWERVPTTVLLGERDEFNGALRLTMARERVDDVRVVDCDHFIPFNLPAFVASVILEEVRARA